MANIITTVTSKFNPFSLEDRIKPYAMINQQWDALSEKYDEALEKASEYEKLANEVDKESDAYTRYTEYAAQLRKAADSMSKGLSNAQYDSLRGLKSTFNQSIKPIGEAWDRREKEREVLRTLKAQGKTNIVVDNDPFMTNIDNYIDTQNQSMSITDLDEVTTHTSEVIKSITEKYQSDSGPNSGNKYDSRTQHLGIPKEELNYILSANSIEELEKYNGKYKEVAQALIGELQRAGYGSHDDIIGNNKVFDAVRQGALVGATDQTSTSYTKNPETRDRLNANDYREAFVLSKGNNEVYRALIRLYSGNASGADFELLNDNNIKIEDAEPPSRSIISNEVDEANFGFYQDSPYYNPEAAYESHFVASPGIVKTSKGENPRNKKDAAIALKGKESNVADLVEVNAKGNITVAGKNIESSNLEKAFNAQNGQGEYSLSQGTRLTGDQVITFLNSNRNNAAIQRYLNMGYAFKTDDNGKILNPGDFAIYKLDSAYSYGNVSGIYRIAYNWGRKPTDWEIRRVSEITGKSLSELKAAYGNMPLWQLVRSMYNLPMGVGDDIEWWDKNLPGGFRQKYNPATVTNANVNTAKEGF